MFDSMPGPKESRHRPAEAQATDEDARHCEPDRWASNPHDTTKGLLAPLDQRSSGLLWSRPHEEQVS